MDRVAYETFRELEHSHFWFVSRRRIFFDQLDRLLPASPTMSATTGQNGEPPTARRQVLEIGCGAGGMLGPLQRYGEAFTIFDELLGGASGTKSKADEQKAVTDDGALLAEAYRLRGIARYGRAMSSSRGVVASSSSGEPSQAAPAPASSSEPAPPRLELKGDTPPARPVSVDAESKRLREGHAEAPLPVRADVQARLGQRQLRAPGSAR